LLVARKAIAAQRRESSPHAQLASLYRYRSWSLGALASVVAAGMLWSAVNVQHNIAPGGPSDPLYWFSYLLEAMISVCLVIIMTGTNKVAQWGIVDNRRHVVAAEVALLGVTVTLNTYPYLRAEKWYDVGVHAVAPMMIGVALLIHDAASVRYGLAISRATDQVSDLPDPAEELRRTVQVFESERVDAAAPSPASRPVAAPLQLTAADPIAEAEMMEPEPEEPRLTPRYVSEQPVRSSSAYHVDRSVDPDDDLSIDTTADTNPFAARVDEALQSVYVEETPPGSGSFAEKLEQEIAELQANRRRSRTSRDA
jgi:hypothetical protein